MNAPHPPRTRTPWRFARLAAVSLCALTLAADAAPTVGGTLPEFTVNDLTGQGHSNRELVGRPSLVLVMTDSDADAAMRAWGTAASQRLRPGVRKVQIVSLSLAFVVPTALARSMARDRSPSSVWRDTWLERDGDLAETLGLPESETPWAMALDERGRITAVAHCEVTSPCADRVWEALAR